MAWTTPLTAVANATLTAAQWNASVRDNLLVTPNALATTAGSHFAVTATNTIVERLSAQATVATSQTTTSATYADLATSGPAVTATTGVLAFTFATCTLSNNTTDADTWFSVDVSGATTSAAVDARAGKWEDVADRQFRFTVATLHALTAGSNSFKIQYRVTSNTGTFLNRNLAVLPL